MKISNREVVYKYDVPATDAFEISMPKGARILTAKSQGEDVKMWAVVDPYNTPETRSFRLAGTGHHLNPMNFKSMEYIDSVKLYDGDLIFHVFEIKQ